MPSHPSRGMPTAASTPAPQAVRALRERYDLTLAQAGAVVHSTGSQWSRWELGPDYQSGRAMHPAAFELANLKLYLGQMEVGEPWPGLDAVLAKSGAIESGPAPRRQRSKCTCGANTQVGEIHTTNCGVFA